MSLIVSFSAGLLFALGLVISGMTNPQKVLGFLDLFGQWDPSLIFVMVGAIAVNGVSFLFIKRRARAWWSPKLFLPESRDLDAKLVGGAILFGVGWGLVGICPGPGLVNLVTFKMEIWGFVAAMVAGMLVYKHTLGR